MIDVGDIEIEAGPLRQTGKGLIARDPVLGGAGCQVCPIMLVIVPRRSHTYARGRNPTPRPDCRLGLSRNHNLVPPLDVQEGSRLKRPLDGVRRDMRRCPQTGNRVPRRVARRRLSNGLPAPSYRMLRNVRVSSVSLAFTL